MGARQQAVAAQMHRTTKDLSGVWAFRFDPKGEGETEKWFAVTDPGKDWTHVRVPGSPNFELAAHPEKITVGDTNMFYRGVMWYHTSFDRAPHAEVRAVLHLAQAALRNKVWVNGKLAGESHVPYQDVAYDVSLLLKAGRNDVVVETDSTVRDLGIPDKKWVGWWDVGGLIGPVTLEERPLSSTQTHYTTTMQPGGGWKLAIHSAANMRPGATNVVVAYGLTNSAGKVVWKQSRRLDPAAAAQEIALDVELPAVKAWSPESPTLYNLHVATTDGAMVDSEELHVGFRQIEVRGSHIHLNGRPIVLRGFNRHQFYPKVGMSTTPAQNLADLNDIKSMGSNFVRLTHYGQAQDVYDDCDRIGLLVWTEIPAWTTTNESLNNAEVWRNDAVPQLTAMVEQHRNHPSVVFYSVCNEILSNTPEGAAYVRKAIPFVKSLDDSRLVTFASNKLERDVAFDAPDVIALNEYYGWYYGELTDVGPMLDKVHEKYPNKPIIVSEYGAEGVPGWPRDKAVSDSKGYMQNYSFAYQAALLRSHLEQIYAPERRGFMSGSAIWQYADEPDPHHGGGNQPTNFLYMNTKGVVTEERAPKPSYAVVKEFFLKLASTQ